ncbi:MAG: hypothetical protein ACI85O_002455 [Saprospiraceae bacterium]|jgi:hypothetical protein
MDMKSQLLAEHSKANADLIKEWVGTDKERFALLVSLFLENEYRTSQRAAMVLGHIHDTYPHLLQPYLPQIIKHLRQPDIHDAIKRNIVRILQNVEIPEEHYGEVADVCFTWLEDPNIAVAIRVFSMSVLWNICQKVPELMPELKATIEDWMDYGSAGFKSRGKKVLKMISKHEIKNSLL